MSPNSYGFGAASASMPVDEIARVVPAGAALAERAEQIAQGAVAEEVDGLVGRLERRRRPVRAVAAQAFAPLALGVEVRAAGDVALLLHLLDDVVDELLDLRRRVGVGRIAEQLLDRLRRQQAAGQQRLEDRVVQILPRHPLVGIGRARVVVEPAREQHVRELRDELLEVDALELVAGVPGVSVLHVARNSNSTPTPSCDRLAVELELGVASVVVLLLAGHVQSRRRRTTPAAPRARARGPAAAGLPPFSPAV